MISCLTARYLREAGWSDWDVIQIRAAKAVVWLIFRPEEATPAIVGKLEFFSGNREEARREPAALVRLAPFSEHLGIPRLFASQELESGIFYLQTAVLGVPLRVDLSPFDSKLIAGQFELIEGWLGQFQALVPHHGDVGAVLRQALTRLESTSVRKALLAAIVKDMPRFSAVPAVAVHGDFFGSNVLVADRRVSVIDWGTFHHGTPLEDLFSFAAGTVFQWEHVERSADLIWKVFFGSSPLAESAQSAALRALARFQLPEDLLGPIFRMYLIDRATRGDFGDAPAWHAVACRYVAAGMPPLWAVNR